MAKRRTHHPPQKHGPLPVSRPRLPSASQLRPYLRRIDETRQYTNWGPLSRQLETRLCDHFNVRRGSVITAASGTAALAGAILALTGRARPETPLAILPAFTFIATAAAIEQCGFLPYLVDVRVGDWLVDPESLARLLPKQTGLVVPVATFGRAVPQAEWIAFRERTGIPVAIDGAASFEAISANPRRHLGQIPVAMSFHATKSFATGEGGCVVTTDRLLSRRTTQALNFGFYESRLSGLPSVNGKMSEYHAAVGLAELRHWSQKRRAFQVLADTYRRCLARVGLEDRLLTTPTVAGCYVLFRCAGRMEAVTIQRSLTRARIGFRLWYGNGLLEHPHLVGAGHGHLEITRAVAPLTIGLPVAIDLATPAVSRIALAIREGIDASRR